MFHVSIWGGLEFRLAPPWRRDCAYDLHPGSTGSQCSQLKSIQNNLIVYHTIHSNERNVQWGFNVYIACVHRDINMSLSITDSCI